MRTASKVTSGAGDDAGRGGGRATHLAAQILPALENVHGTRRDFGWRPGRFSGGRSPDLPVGGMTKRAVDVVVASAVLLILLPLLVTVAVLLWATQGGSIIFQHPRVGFRGRRFQCYKFRTMLPNADELLKRYLAANPEAAEEWRVNQKLKHDPRVTFIGSLIRRSSIDELPQLINVLKGDMSCVGPRPVVEAELARYGAEADQYLRARPGITGLWQVSGRNRLSYEARVALDSDYVRNWNLKRDFVIALKTIPALLRLGDTS